MAAVCEICGDVGYGHLLLSCDHCKCAMHQYCLAKVLFDGSLVERWFCDECLPKHGEVTYEGFLQKAPKHARSGSVVRRASTLSVRSTREAGPCRNHNSKSEKSKCKSRRKKCSSSKNSLLRKHKQKGSDMQPMGNKTITRDCNAPNISCDSEKELHSCEVMTIETSKAGKAENQQIDHGHCVHTLNNDCVANCLPARVKQINLQNPLDEFEPPLGDARQLDPSKDNDCLSPGNVEIENLKGHVTPVVARGNQRVPNISCDSGKALHSCEVMTIETSKVGKEENQQIDHGHCVHTLNNDCVANCLPARVKQINLQNPLDEFEPPLGDARQLNPSKDSDCLSPGNVEIENPMGHVTPVVARGNQSVPSTLLDRVDSGSFPGTNLKEIVLLEDSDTSAEHFYTVENCVKDNQGKQIQLIVLDDDEEEAEDVQSEDYNHRSLECDGSLSKRRIGMEDCAEQAVQTGDLNGQNLNAVHLDILIPKSCEITQPVKKRRRNIEANEDNKDEEVLIGTSNRKCALDDASKLTSETLVATDPVLVSRMAFDSEFANQQCSMYSQPTDEPIWSGILKINNEVYISLTAHLSTTACVFVRELSRSLQPVVKVIKLPQLEAWPQSWRTSRPTDGDIALYFFPPSASPNEESDGPVEESIDSGAVLQAVIGVAELLIFPSTMLPAQYHLCQGKRYLWGMFKHREDESDKDHPVEEQDGSACAKEGEIQEHIFMDRQYEVQCESPDHETSTVKHVVHVENQLLVEQNCGGQEATMSATMGLHSPGNNSSSAEPNPPKARSNCFTQPRADSKPDVPEEVDHQDEQNFTKPSADSAGPAAATPSSIDSAECGAAPPVTQLFGFFTARTPRAQKLIQEMVSEGALLFSVAEEIATGGSAVGSNTGAQVHLAPDSASPPMQERCQPIGFVPLDDDVASEACLELFPVRQEHIGWTPRVETSKEVDLDLSLSARSRASSGSIL
ncbi:uncharacterized protein LOC125508322 [Triticum urartu]|uniref:PHD-type domain-containing protein n=1 Tax=Triticum urartu TaxID=4572 RepID=A0A8R7QBW3_TRIUA|nr:uncharacterized protein LOC125508322 [Triticum urartu]